MPAPYQPLTNYSRATQQLLQPQTQAPVNTVPQQAPQQYQPIGMIWVKGLNGANDYPVARGATLALFDQDDERFYIKSVDMYTNQQTVRAFSYEEIKVEQLNGTVDMSKYVTVDKFNEVLEELEELKAQQKNRNTQYKNNYKKKDTDEQ